MINTPIQQAPVELGDFLFQFDSFSAWVNTAQRVWRDHKVRATDTLCLDAQGRVCLIGLHFMVARDEQAFPIRVYLARKDMTPEPAKEQS